MTAGFAPVVRLATTFSNISDGRPASSVWASSWSATPTVPSVRLRE